MLHNEIFEEFTLIRQSPTLLFIKLFLLEILSIIVYLFVDYTGRVIYPPFNLSIFSEDRHLIEIILFSLMNLFEIIFMMYLTLQWISNYYIIRAESILHREGIFHLKEETFSLKNIETFTVDQWFVGRVLGYGHIKFYSPVLKQEYYLKNVSQPVRLKNVIEKMLTTDESLAKEEEKIIPKKG